MRDYRMFWGEIQTQRGSYRKSLLHEPSRHGSEIKLMDVNGTLKVSDSMPADAIE
jgi:hypothetical protein